MIDRSSSSNFKDIEPQLMHTERAGTDNDYIFIFPTKKWKVHKTLFHLL